MANYLQGPAYNTYQVDPYRLPVQQIVQAIDTRNKYWDVGASQIKSAYQSYLNLDLSLPANQQKLDTLMQGVNTNLKKVVSTDLSLADNVSTAMDIFDPITKDEGIKYDNAVTKFYKGEMQKAQSLKTVDGGKYYSDTNVSDMLTPLEDFIKGNDPTKGREAYGKRRYYTPYHDIMADWNAAEKTFKPDTLALTQPETETYVDDKGVTRTRLTNSGRMVEEKNKSIIASQFRAYMSTHLPDKAKDQLHINGRVAYKDHPDILAGDYLYYNNEKIITYTREIKELEGKKTAAAKSGQTAQAELYQHDIDQYKSEVKKLTVTNTKLRIKDYSELNRDKEAIAGQLYTSSWIDNISKSSERRDIEVKYSRDDVALFWAKMGNDNEQKDLDRQSAEKIAGMRGKGKTKVDANGNEIVDTEPQYGVSTEDNNTNFGKPEVDKMITTGTAIKTNAADAYNKYLTELKVIDPSRDKATNDAAAEEWHKNNPNDYHWKEYREQLDIGDANLAAGKAIQEFVDSELKTKYPNLAQKKQELINNITTGETIKFREGAVNLSKEDLKTIAKGDNPDITIEDVPANIRMGVPYKTSYLKYKGEKYLIENRDSPGFAGTQLSKIIHTVREIDTNTDEAVNKLYNQAVTDIQGLEKFTQKPGTQEGESPLLEKVQNVIFGILGATGIKQNDITVTARDRLGGIYFKVDATKDGVSPSQIKTIIEASGGKYKKQYEGGSYYLPNSEIGSYIKPRSYSDPRLEPIQTQVDFKVARTKTGDLFNSTTIKFGDRDFHFRVTNKSGVPMYEIIDEDSGAAFYDFATQQPFSTLEAASGVAAMLANLKPEDLEQKIRDPLQGNKPNYRIKHQDR